MSRKLDQYALLPLYPFESMSDSINLKWGIRITRASDELRRRVSEIYETYDYILTGTKLKWMACLPFVGNSVDDFMPKLPRKYLESRMFEFVYIFVTALRLHNAGLITPGPIVLSDETVVLYWLYESSKRDYTFQDKEPPKFELRQSDITIVNKIMQDIHTWRRQRDRDGMNIAVERFHASYSGPPEERLIDQMIAFEAIYLGDDKELAYKLSLRTAYFVSEDLEQRKKIFNDMKNAYSIRGHIVHGSEKVNLIRLREILPETENYLRISIKKVLSLLASGYKFKEIRQHLFDNTILMGK